MGVPLAEHLEHLVPPYVGVARRLGAGHRARRSLGVERPSIQNRTNQKT